MWPRDGRPRHHSPTRAARRPLLQGWRAWAAAAVAAAVLVAVLIAAAVTLGIGA